MGAAVPVGLTVHEQHRLALLGRQGTAAGQRAHTAIEHHMGRNKSVHHLERVGIAFPWVGKPHVGSIIAARDVEIVLADIVDAIIADRLTQMILQPVAWQHHDAARHPRHHMPRDHRTAWRAVIDKDAWSRCLEPQHRLFAGVHQGQRPATQCARRRMKIDVVLHRVFGRVEQRQLDIVALVDNHHRAGNRAVEGHRLQPGVFIDLNFLLDDPHLEFDDFRACGRHLIMRMHEGGCDQLDLATGQRRKVDRCGTGVGRSFLGVGGFDDKGRGRNEGPPHQRCAAGEHHDLLF